MCYRAYDPSEYEHLQVSTELKELFQHIRRYSPQTMELDTKLKPFVPEFIPAIGDIDAFLKVHNVENLHRRTSFHGISMYVSCPFHHELHVWNPFCSIILWGFSLQVSLPDGRSETLGLNVLDEPRAKQSDPTVLDLQLRTLAKQTTVKPMVCKPLL